jgi:hypothetical protein
MLLACERGTQQERGGNAWGRGKVGSVAGLLQLKYSSIILLAPGSQSAFKRGELNQSPNVGKYPPPPR